MAAPSAAPPKKGSRRAAADSAELRDAHEYASALFNALTMLSAVRQEVPGLEDVDEELVDLGDDVLVRDRAGSLRILTGDGLSLKPSTRVPAHFRREVQSG